MIIFEWDTKKNRSNIEKHGVSFEEASTVFQDTLSLTIDDPLHSIDEERLILIGMSQKNRILVVVHTERGDNIRIISARKTNKKEREYYESNGK
ncbi:MAG: BrnT family toxin [Candidatus Marinimicrobia bacterium]|nr:BrnT family toxin [Candidatus Neomarinimicrobiota bacterium]